MEDQKIHVLSGKVAERVARTGISFSYGQIKDTSPFIYIVDSGILYRGGGSNATFPFPFLFISFSSFCILIVACCRIYTPNPLSAQNHFSTTSSSYCCPLFVFAHVINHSLLIFHSPLFFTSLSRPPSSFLVPSCFRRLYPPVLSLFFPRRTVRFSSSPY